MTKMERAKKKDQQPQQNHVKKAAYLPNDEVVLKTRENLRKNLIVQKRLKRAL